MLPDVACPDIDDIDDVYRCSKDITYSINI